MPRHFPEFQCLYENVFDVSTSTINFLPAAGTSSQAISYGNAKSLLLNLTGISVEKWKDWKGGLNISYHSGPSSNLVAIEVQQPRKVSTIVNIVATFQGEIEPEKRVIVGMTISHIILVCVILPQATIVTRGCMVPRIPTAALPPSWSLQDPSAFFISRVGGLEDLLFFAVGMPKSKLFSSFIGPHRWSCRYGLLGSVEYAEEFQKELQQNAIAYLNV